MGTWFFIVRVEMKLPEPRDDGKCADCGTIDAVTRDQRFCKKCLKRRVRYDNPMIGCYKGKYRTADHKQDQDRDNPWQQNAVRDMEDTR